MDFDDFMEDDTPCESDNKSMRCAAKIFVPTSMAFMCVVLVAALGFGAMRKFYDKHWPFGENPNVAARRRNQPPPFEVTVEKVRPEKDGGRGGEKFDGQYGFNNPGKVNA